MSEYKGKQVSFNLSDPNDKLLLQKLSTLPHGEFSEKTKQFWKHEFKIKENDGK